MIVTTFTKPAAWVLACIMMPLGVVMSISVGMSETAAQRLVWNLTGLIILIYSLSLVVRLLRKSKPAGMADPPAVMDEKGKAHG